ncbi:uncharacterized protein [Spinacia oleracea]|uniref:Ubiquitin-like protease family profile domain-containing protein n=1 Tax=Spinacia oleracea TaxID=3562 RepID=A0ABM3RRY6_SPIOL|nr:uncharacterized protein LOC130472001 [Spinacia oleracea]
MDVRDEIDMNKLQNPTKSKNTGRSSEQPKIGTEKQSDMTETGQYQIENEIETGKQIDKVQEQPQRLILKFKRRPTKSQPEVQKVLSEGDGNASSTSETEVQKSLSEEDDKSSSKSQPEVTEKSSSKSQSEVQKTSSEVDQEDPSKSMGQHVSETTFSKEHKAEQQKKKDAAMVAAAAAKASKEAEERIATPAVAAKIGAEKRAPAADAETKRVAEEKASAAEKEAKRLVEEKAYAADAEAKRVAEEKASAADAEARRLAEEKASAADAEREAEKKEAENKRMEANKKKEEEDKAEAKKKDIEERKKEYEDKMSQLIAKNNKELIEEAERKEAERKEREAERNKKEDDDATKAIAKVVGNVNASESADPTNGGNGTRKGRKTTANKKKAIQNIYIDEALQKKLHNISDSYNPRRSTRSMVKVQENVCAEIVTREEFDGKDVSEVTSKVTNTPKKRKVAEKEVEDEPLDVEITKTKKQKGVEKKASVKGRILPLRIATKRNKKKDTEEVKDEQKTGLAEVIAKGKRKMKESLKKRKEQEEEVQEEEDEEKTEEEEEEEEEDEEDEEDEEWEEEEVKQQKKMKKKQTVPVKDRTTPKANLPAEKKRKRKIADEDWEGKEENENDDIYNSEKDLIVEREASPLAMITKEVPARKKPMKSIAVYKERVEEEEQEKTGVRGGHGKFITFISMINEQKKEAVRNIGLGALLDFQLPTSSQQFVTWLCNNFEENSQNLYLPKNEKILIEFEDVKKIYGLPSGEVEIVEAKSDKASEEFSAFMASWKKIFVDSKWNPLGNKVPSVQKILKYYSREDQIEAGPDANFITSFLVVTVNTLIKSTLSNQAYFKFLFSMMNHEQIQNLNWCKYVWEALLSTTAQYKKNLKLKDKATFFTGPLPLLTIFYFDRVQRMNFFPPRRIPLVSCYTKEIGQKRNKLEESGFGLGKVLPKINIEEKQTRKEFMDEFVGIIQAVGDNLSKLSDSLKKAQEFFPGNELVSKVEEFLSKMAKEPSLSQDEWSDDFIKALLEKEKELLDAIDLEKKKAKKDNIKKAFDLGLTPSPMVDDDKLKGQKAGTSTSTPSFSLEEIDESLASAMLNLKQRREEEKKENEIAKAKKMIQAESEVSEPASEEPKTTVENIVVQEEKIVSLDAATVEPELHVSEMMPVTNVIQEKPAPEVSNEKDPAPQVIKKKVTTDGVEEQPATYKTNENVEPQVLENKVATQMVQKAVEAEQSVGAEQSSLPSPKLQNEKGDEGKRPQRIHKLPAAFSSPYLVKYRDLFKNLDTMHQSLEDYVLSGQDNREDMKTLVDEVEVVDCVIDSWSKYLNAKGHKDKLFLSTVPYIFIPVLAAKHLYLLVINHYNATVDVIDNRPLPRNVKFEAKYEGHPEVVLDAFAKYMGTFGYEVEPMQKYEMNLLKMKWRSMKDYTNCGVYVMKHMETYTGDPEHKWICDLKANDTNQIRKLRVTFCGLLMLSKQNEKHESNINEAWRS